MTSSRDLKVFLNWNVEIVSSLKIEFESKRKRIRRRKVAFILLHDRYVERSVKERARQNNLTRETDSRVRLILNVLKRVLPRRNTSIYFFVSLSILLFISFAFLLMQSNTAVRYFFTYRKYRIYFNIETTVHYLI